MTIVSAFLVTGSPLHLLQPDNPAYRKMVEGFRRAAAAIEASRPDSILIYSTEWMAVLDQLWQTRPAIKGLHVDENWHELGDIPFDITVDTELTYACISATSQIGIRSKEVNYDGFPIDTGTLVATALLNLQRNVPFVLTSNNLYHSPEQTAQLGKLAVQKAHDLNKRVCVLGVGGLSGTLFRETIDLTKDHIASREDDRLNREMMAMIESADVRGCKENLPNYAKNAKVDMGGKHFHWVMGALDWQWNRGVVHGYGSAYGSGTAVIEFQK